MASHGLILVVKVNQSLLDPKGASKVWKRRMKLRFARAELAAKKAYDATFVPGAKSKVVEAVDRYAVP